VRGLTVDSLLGYKDNRSWPATDHGANYLARGWVQPSYLSSNVMLEVWSRWSLFGKM